MNESQEEMMKSLQLYRKLLRTTSALRKELSASLEQHGLTGSQYAVLDAIPEEGITHSVIAKLVRRDPSNITGIVDRLEQSDLIRRGLDANDRRVIRVYITPTGEALRDKINTTHPANVHRGLSKWSSEDKHKMMELLEKLEQE